MHGSAPWKTEETIVGLPRLLVLSVFQIWWLSPLTFAIANGALGEEELLHPSDPLYVCTWCFARIPLPLRTPKGTTVPRVPWPRSQTLEEGPMAQLEQTGLSGDGEAGSTPAGFALRFTLRGHTGR